MDLLLSFVPSELRRDSALGIMRCLHRKPQSESSFSR
jgi:hypothetical protein